MQWGSDVSKMEDWKTPSTCPITEKSKEQPEAI